MPEPLDQNSSDLNQEILSPDQQVWAGRMLPKQQYQKGQFTGQKIKPSWQDQEAFDIDEQDYKQEQASAERERKFRAEERREKREAREDKKRREEEREKRNKEFEERKRQREDGGMSETKKPSDPQAESQASTSASPSANKTNVPQDNVKPEDEKDTKKSLDKAIEKAEKPVALADKAVSKIGAGAQASVKSLIGFSYPVWLAAIILAGIYDLVGVGSAQLLSEFDWIADLVLGGGITILLWTQGSKARQAKKIIETTSTTILEMIPGIGVLNLWTIMVLWQFYRAYNEHEAEQIKKMQEQKTQSQTAE